MYLVLTATKWYATMRTMAATPRPLERSVRVSSEIMVQEMHARPVASRE